MHKKDIRLLPSPGQWGVADGAVYSIDGRRLLLADRNNPQTWPTERDANVRLAAEAHNLLQEIVDAYGPIMDNDEPYPGCDAVDDMADIVRKARRILHA
jgi:hypothetical protein